MPGTLPLRREVEALLSAHAADNPLDRPPADLALTGDHNATDAGPSPAEVGDRIGPYRLMEQIGEGGFGLVFVAEQSEPVRRKVALKVIKPGMDTRDVVARFEAERQALALMDHPNIARVLDAGSTPHRPPLLRDGAGPRRADHRLLRCAQARSEANAWRCSSRCARPSSTPTRRG